MIERERLIDLIRGARKKTKGANCDLEREMLFADHLLANGVIVPPCKVGDTVYCVENKSIHEGIVESVKSLTYGNGTKFFVRVECEIEDPFYNDGRKMKHGIMAVWGIEWGSWHMAFPTIEEAEKALAERGET